MTIFPLDDSALATLKNTPLPAYDGYEPDELAIVRFRKYLEEGRFDDLPQDAQHWVCGRLMPSLVRFGCYPPPHNPA